MELEIDYKEGWILIDFEEAWDRFNDGTYTTYGIDLKNQTEQELEQSDEFDLYTTYGYKKKDFQLPF